MNSVSIRDVTHSDLDKICALNREEVQHTSEMDLRKLIELDLLSFYHRVSCIDGQVAGFLLAMRNGAAYANDNFSWFASRYTNFIYIDRIVVSAESRGMSLGSLLYQDLFHFARNAGIAVVTCEFNIIPSNEPSRIFHEKFGFAEKGTQWVANGTKLVSLQAAEI